MNTSSPHKLPCQTIFPFLLIAACFAFGFGLTAFNKLAYYPADVDDFMLEFKKAYQQKNVSLYKSLCAAQFINTNDYNTNVEQIAKGIVKRIFFPDQDIDVTINRNEASIRYIPITIIEHDTTKPIYRHKMVNLFKAGETWKIKEDRLDTRTIEQLEAQASGYPGVERDAALKILQVIEEWRVAWESENLGKYMSYYSSDAQIIRVTVFEGKEHRKKFTQPDLKAAMQRLNKLYKWMQIRVTNMEMKQNSEVVVTAQFIQEFKASVREGNIIYYDLGFKKLIFNNRENEWKIVSEDWRMYEKIRKY
jgi:hypothetical protein